MQRLCATKKSFASNPLILVQILSFANELGLRFAVVLKHRTPDVGRSLGAAEAVATGGRRRIWPDKWTS